MSALVVPERSLQQRMDALQIANATRSYRKVLRREVKCGERDPIEVILHPPAEVETMRVFDLLLIVPKLGRAKVNRIVSRARVSPSKTVGGLSQRQRDELVALIRCRGLRP